jgi:hypothetical protein
MQTHHHAEQSDTGALAPTLWLGAAIVAMVVFSYWLNWF